jgi:hypothetical protein
MRTLSFESIFRVVVCAVVMALIVRTLSWLWRYLWDIRITDREAGLLVVIVIGLMAGFNLIREYGTASIVGSSAIGGYFLLKAPHKARLTASRPQPIDTRQQTR